MKIIFLITFLVVIPQLVLCQKKVSITIDDVPNIKNYARNSYHPDLLQKLDLLDIPIIAFVNEGLIFKSDSLEKNITILKEWFKRNYIAIGNHSFAHSRYSEVVLEDFKIDITKDSKISHKLSLIYDKPIEYFRFPFNDLGKDSSQQAEIHCFIKSEGYKIAPFTIESSDWIFNRVYEYYLEKSDTNNARLVAHDYVNKTIEFFEYFEDLSDKFFGRPINHIYLCHDNRINADYLDVLINKLAEDGYKFISFSEALSDKVYDQQNYYKQKGGISWIYRWLSDQQERIKYMKQEPSIEKIVVLFNTLIKK